MITATISEYLEIWPRVFSYMISSATILIIFGSLLMSIDVLITWLTPSKRFQRYLQQGNPIFLYNLKGWLRYFFVLILYLAWGAFLLTPILSFIPIVFFDIRTRVLYWELLGMIVLIVLYYWKIHKFHKRIAFTKYYFEKQCLGIRYFNNDIIIPYQAIVTCLKDNSLLRSAIEFQFQLRLLHWTRKTTYYFQFSTQETYDAFIESFTEVAGFEWKEKELSAKEFRTLSYDTIQFLNRESLKNELPDRVWKILSQHLPPEAT